MLSAIPGTSFYSCIFRAFGDWHPLRLPQDGAGRTWGISNETITWITGKGRQKQPQANSWISTHLVSSIWPMFIFCWLQMVTVYFLSSNTSVPTWSADFKSSQRHQPESKEEERNCASDNRHLCTKASNGSPLLSKWYEEQSSWVVGTSWYMNKITNKYYIYIFGEREREIKASCKAASQSWCVLQHLQTDVYSKLCRFVCLIGTMNSLWTVQYFADMLAFWFLLFRHWLSPKCYKCVVLQCLQNKSLLKQRPLFSDQISQKKQKNRINQTQLSCCSGLGARNVLRSSGLTPHWGSPCNLALASLHDT